MDKTLLSITIAIGFLLVPFSNIDSKAGNLLNSTVFADSNKQSEIQDLHSNNSLVKPVNWNNWQKEPLLDFNFSQGLDSVQGNDNVQDTISIDAAWHSEGDTEANASINGNTTFYHYTIPAKPQIPAKQPPTLNSINVDGKHIANSDVKSNQFLVGKSLGASFVFPFKKSMVNQTSIDTKPEDKNNHLRSTIQIKYKDPNLLNFVSGTVSANYFNNDYLSITNPQIVRIFYKNSKTGLNIKKPVVLGENETYQYALEDIMAPEIKGYVLKQSNSIEYQQASVSIESIINALDSASQKVMGITPNELENEKFKESFDQFFGNDPTTSLLNYTDLSSQEFLTSAYGLGTSDIDSDPDNFLINLVNLVTFSGKPFSVYNYLRDDTTKYMNGNVVKGIKLDKMPQAITFWYNRAPATPTTPMTPGTPSTPTTSSSSSSSTSSTSSSSSSTPTSSSSASSSGHVNLPNYAATKGSVVYAINKIGLYQSTNFSAAKRSVWYTKKPRIYRPMFVVTGYRRDSNGRLRYEVKDVNHASKTDGKVGYITADQKYVRPVYYVSKPATVTVINPRGVNAYRKANLTKRAKNYRQGTVLHVKAIVTHNLTTRYVLTNGDYITANRKLVNMGRHKQVKAIKTKRTLNRYGNVNFTKKNHVIAKDRTLKVYGYDYSHGNSMTKRGTLRYRVAGGYITANTKYVRAYK
ncbi:DUF5776 domain-containing protein [Lentilactobacillus farraginis]|uniref:DUF5776 domain-containing protein n=1 Tax=Lentilactobacillus farraginis DSM 18382 = JCM 14108 TaxID=1423743 RepID=X0PM39_9LACO|nr:DUF5776 domain-containing protein [Lentilactobacillus farraginis]GAF37896.1 hypothetical protein JCM14108_2980 [Lentilactobacillus farraginis DSM 18382 = JCM 14108]